MAEKIKYDPDKRYSWTPEDKFFLTGQEFGIVLNALRAILNTPESKKVILAIRASEAIENSLAQAVESGQVKEDLSEQKSE